MSEIQNKESKTDEAVDSAIHIPVVSGLLACPFCGKKVQVNENKANKFFELIHECNNTFSVILIDNNKDSLIARWNTRSKSFEPDHIKELQVKYTKELKDLKHNMKTALFMGKNCEIMHRAEINLLVRILKDIKEAQNVR